MVSNVNSRKSTRLAENSRYANYISLIFQKTAKLRPILGTFGNRYVENIGFMADERLFFDDLRSISDDLNAVSDDLSAISDVLNVASDDLTLG